MKKLFLLLVLILLFFSACSCSFFNPQISEITTASRINSKTLEPAEKATTFTESDEVIYCVVYIKNVLNKQTTIKADWIFLKDNSQISSETQKIRGTGYVAFQKKRPEEGWPKGKYRVEVFLGETKSTTEFEIK